MSAQVTHGDFRATVGNEVVPYNMMTKYLLIATLDLGKVFSNPDRSSSHLDHSHMAISAALEGNPFS
jgi:hypothetical protein